jgi:hypothetical protein
MGKPYVVVVAVVVAVTVSQPSTARSPDGALTRTAGMHGFEPAATTLSALGSPLVTTCTGSWFGTLNTVYCHLPAQVGWVVTVIWTFAARLSLGRTAAITWLALGRPLQLVATYSLKPDALGRVVGTGSRLGAEGSTADGDGGRALGSRVGRTGSSAQAPASTPMTTIIDARIPVVPGRIAPPDDARLHGAEEGQ